MAASPLRPPDPRRRVDAVPSAAERAELDARLARLAMRRTANASATRATSHHDLAARSTRPRPGRRHPAARARLAAVGLSLASTAGLVTLFAASRSAGAGSGSAGAIVRSTATTTAQPVAGQPSSGADQLSTLSAPSASSTVVDGAVFHNRWGDVQVEATFDAQGALVDVVALQTPDSRDKSIRINEYAVPLLTNEALTDQSASIDSISGATYTSTDYIRSLQSAIDAARAANATPLA
jgi:hypothetical protein